MKKLTFLFATAAMVLASSCTNDVVVDNSVSKAQVNSSAINFGGGSNNVTRANDVGGSEAAALLNNTFRVCGGIESGAAETPVVDK